MKRLFFYNNLSFVDLVRLRAVLWPQIAVVVGVCLPLLLLQGLKRGHVAELQKDLRESPVGRQVLFWSGNNDPLGPSALIRLRKELKGVDTIIGHAEHIGTLRNGDAVVKDLTLRSTSRGDPLLQSYDAGVLEQGEKAIVLSARLAEKLKVKVGKELTLMILGTDDKEVSVKLNVKSVLRDLRTVDVAYLDLKVHNWIEEFLRGYGAPELGWPSSLSIGDSYSGYLLFCEADNDLTKEDRLALKTRDFYLEEVKDKKTRYLFGLLKTDDLKIYFLRGFDSHVNPRRRLRENPADLARITAVDDVVLAWNRPQQQIIDGVQWNIVGCSLPKRCWLRLYLKNRNWAFEYDQELFSIRFPNTEGQARSVVVSIIGAEKKVTLSLQTVYDHEKFYRRLGGIIGTLGGPGSHIGAGAIMFRDFLFIKNRKAGNGDGNEPVAVIPVNLLAQLDGLKHGTVRYDPIRKGFIPTPDEISYRRVRLYCHTIDEVPSVVKQLDARGYAYESENDRIAEIQRQDSSLQSIVFIVIVCVVFFGVWTISCVLFESTARKHRTIGIMRVMGVSKFGIFYIVVARAGMIGVLAGCIAAATGWAVSGIATSFVLTSMDITILFVGALLCAIIGSLYPAWKASHVDPFDAIVEGKLS